MRPFAQYWGSNRAGMDSDFADMKAGGITWARIDLFNTSPPDPNFDYAVQSAKAHGINLLVTVHKTPPETDLGTDADRAVYRTWLGQMVDRYKYHVKYWAIHNEPNLHYEWNIDDNAGRCIDPRQFFHCQDRLEELPGDDRGLQLPQRIVKGFTVLRIPEPREDGHFVIGENDHPRFKDFLQRWTQPGSTPGVVGYFRSQVREGLRLNEEDIALIEAFFADPGNVYLIVQPCDAEGGPVGGFFFSDIRFSLSACSSFSRPHG